MSFLVFASLQKKHLTDAGSNNFMKQRTEKNICVIIPNLQTNKYISKVPIKVIFLFWNHKNIFSGTNQSFQSNALSTLQLAMTNFFMMKIKYQKLDSLEISEREIEPAALYSYDEKWIVIGWCHLRNDYRTFRLDRILEFKLLEKKFEDRKFHFSTTFRNDYDASQCPSKLEK